MQVIEAPVPVANPVAEKKHHPETPLTEILNSKWEATVPGKTQHFVEAPVRVVNISSLEANEERKSWGDSGGESGRGTD